MKLKLNKKAMIQYFLIFLMLISQGSHLYSLNTYGMSMLILGVCSLLIIRYKKIVTKNIVFMCLLLAGTVFFVRMLNSGGAGISVLTDYISKILIMYIAYSYDKEKFPYRFVRIVYVFAVISLVFYGISLISPMAVKSLTSFHRYTEEYKTTFHGLLLYVLREAEIDRNTGIYMEPGLYQIVLCTCLYLLLFYRKSIGLENRKRERYIFVLILTIISTKSTSGLLGMSFLITIYLITKKDGAKRKIFALAALSLALLGINYSINPDKSIIMNNFVSKIMDESNQINLSASSGKYRMQVVEICMETIGNHPLGIGYDNTLDILFAKYPGAAGAALAIDIMALGIFPILIILCEFLRQSFRNRQSVYNVIIFIFFYLNAALAQSSIFYPTLVIIAYIENEKKFGQSSIVSVFSTGREATTGRGSLLNPIPAGIEEEG